MTQTHKKHPLQREISARLVSMTQTALAEELGVTQGTISYLKWGNINRVSIKTRRHIAEQLGLHLYERKPRATIQFRPETRARLTAYKRSKRETFDDVVVRLLDFVDRFKKEVTPMQVQARDTDYSRQVEEIYRAKYEHWFVVWVDKVRYSCPLEHKDWAERYKETYCEADAQIVRAACNEDALIIAAGITEKENADKIKLAEFNLCKCGHTREEHAPIPSLACEAEVFDNKYSDGHPCFCACFELDEEML